MSTAYRAVQWNLQKAVYDGIVLALIVLAIGVFATVSRTLHPGMGAYALLIRSSGFLSLFLVQLILCIGPLARISPVFIPLLYNRRHLGVYLFFLAALHGSAALIRYHAHGDTFPLVSVFTAYASEYAGVLVTPANLVRIPFEPFGALALLLLFLLAATSHDFWLRLLGPTLWKGLHLLAYPAYALILLHVALGFLQTEMHLVYPVLILAGAALVFLLHLAAFYLGQFRQPPAPSAVRDAFSPVCKVSDLEENKGKAVRIGQCRIALFRRLGRVYAVSGVCRHQGGPLGEGMLVEGCITCPWHGRQYKLEDGTALAPAEAHLATYPVEVRDGMVYVKPVPHASGTVSEGAALSSSASRLDPEALIKNAENFYIGGRNTISESLANALQITTAVLLMAAPLFMAAVAVAQSGPGTGYFEYGQRHTVEGVLYLSPVPSLYVLPPSSTSSSPEGVHLLLATHGKFGIPDTWNDLHGKKIEVQGRLMYRDDTALFEVTTSDRPRVVGDPPPDALRPEPVDLGAITLVGELVNVKCYLGAHQPAMGKVHRACAIRSFSGGSLPGIPVSSTGGQTVVVLSGPEGYPLEFDSTLAARIVRVDGVLERANGYTVLRVNAISVYDPDGPLVPVRPGPPQE